MPNMTTVSSMITSFSGSSGDEPRLFAGLDERADAGGEVGVVERRELVHAARPMLPRDLEALDVFLRRLGVRRLGEDEDLVLDSLLQLAEALVDRAPLAQDLDVVEWVAFPLSRCEGRREQFDHLAARPLQAVELLAPG